MIDTENLNNTLNEIYKNIKHLMDQVLLGNTGGLCVGATKLGHRLLSERGVHVRVAGGKAAFSVNKGKWGMMDYGYDPKPQSGGRYIGHFWLVCDDGIIDFTLPTLKRIMDADNLRRGLPKQKFMLPEQIFVPFSQLSTFDQLYAGAIGWHYIEQEGRGEQIWLDNIPDLHKM